jgi:hypothetical protein
MRIDLNVTGIIFLYVGCLVLNCLFFFYMEEMFFGTFLHNYSLLLKNGKYSSIINDIPNWKLYHNHNVKNKNINKKYDIRHSDMMMNISCKALDTVFDQGSCPSCFPFALASVLGTKLCTASKQTNNIMPSPYRIFDCAGNDCKDGDRGVKANNIVKVMMEGVPDITMSPQVFGWGCQRGGIKTKGYNDICGITWIQREVILNGPVIIAVDLKRRTKELAQFQEWGDLEFRFDGKDGVGDEGYGSSSSMTLFKQAKAKNHLDLKKDDEITQLEASNKRIIEISMHALMIIGWDDYPVPHWIVKNSWGHTWGQNGIGRVPWRKKDCAFTFEPSEDHLLLVH